MVTIERGRNVPPFACTNVAEMNVVIAGMPWQLSRYSPTIEHRKKSFRLISELELSTIATTG